MIYNGKVHIPLTVTSEMVGHKFGEYVFTRKKFSTIFTNAVHKVDLKKNKNRIECKY
jgi:ribosomal protein S19